MKLLTDEAVVSTLTQAFQDKPAGGLYPEEFRKVVSDMSEDIVRCRDCRWWDAELRECCSPNWTDGFNQIVQPAGMYCGWGEKKDEA